MPVVQAEPGFATGRKSRTYVNTGTRNSPVIVEITHITKENFDPGEQNFMNAEARDLARDIQEEGGTKNASLSFTRLVTKGNVTDTAYTTLVSSYGTGAAKLEFFVLDDAIEKANAKGWRFWGKISKMPLTRDVGAMTEQAWDVKELTHFNAAGVQEGLIAYTSPGGSPPTTTTTAAP